MIALADIPIATRGRGLVGAAGLFSNATRVSFPSREEKPLPLASLNLPSSDTASEEISTQMDVVASKVETCEATAGPATCETCETAASDTYEMWQRDLRYDIRDVRNLWGLRDLRPFRSSNAASASRSREPANLERAHDARRARSGRAMREHVSRDEAQFYFFWLLEISGMIVTGLISLPSTTSGASATRSCASANVSKADMAHAARAPGDPEGNISPE